ncbi:MAG: DUF6159 family protein [Planctomycetota bacterium]
MGFFDRLANGWSLAWESVKIVWANKKLMVFPIISTIVLVLVLGSFTGVLFGTGTVDALLEEGEGGRTTQEEVLGYVLLFAFYFVSWFIIIFFNMALIHCANYAMNGAEFSVGTGLSFSFSRIGAVAGWALVSATVGVILRIIEDRSDRIMQIVVSLIGMAWAILTFFVIPVIAYEDLGPFAAIKRSGELFKRTWGERVGARFAFGLVGFALVLLIALPVGILLFLVHPVAGIVGAILCIVVISVLTATAQTVFKAAAYQYAIGRPVESFSSQRLENAFAPR